MTDASSRTMDGSAVTECLQCGTKGRHTHDAYASSRVCIEKGKVCDECWRGLLAARNRKPRVYTGTWSLTKAQGRVGY